MSRSKIVRSAVRSVVIAAVCYVAVAVTLVFAGGGPKAGDGAGLTFEALKPVDGAALPPLRTMTASDGATLSYRYYPAETSRVVVLYHGSGYRGSYLFGVASAIAGAGVARVYVPNVRGHYRSGPIRGDIGHIGQLEDDTEALLALIRKTVPDARIVLGGHSSGGGYAVRYAGSARGETLRGVLLFAPYLGYNAPTTRADSGGWAQTAMLRIVGLSMLNAVGITQLNGLPTLGFRMPERVRDSTETLSYSYRLMTNFAPHRDFAADLAGVAAPMLVLAGANDEAMIADAYKPLLAGRARTEVEILPRAAHLDIVSDPRAIARAVTWLRALD